MMKYLSSKILVALSLAAGAIPIAAQTCQTREEMPEQTRTAIESSAKQIFDQASRADVNAVKASASPSLQSGFNGVAAAINDNKDTFTGATPQLRTLFLLDTGTGQNTDGTFYCGVYGSKGTSSGGAQFSIPGLPDGKYAIAIQDFVGNKGPYALTTIFQDVSGWKLA